MADDLRSGTELKATAIRPVRSTTRRFGALLIGFAAFFVGWTALANVLVWLLGDKLGSPSSWAPWLLYNLFSGRIFLAAAKYSAGQIAKDYPSQVLIGLIAGVVIVGLVAMILSTLAVTSTSLKWQGTLLIVMFAACLTGVAWQYRADSRSGARR